MSRFFLFLTFSRTSSRQFYRHVASFWEGRNYCRFSTIIATFVNIYALAISWRHQNDRNYANINLKGDNCVKKARTWIFNCFSIYIGKINFSVFRSMLQITGHSIHRFNWTKLAENGIKAENFNKMLIKHSVTILNLQTKHRKIPRLLNWWPEFFYIYT